MDLRYFDYCRRVDYDGQGDGASVFGGRHVAGSDITQREMDLAARSEGDGGAVLGWRGRLAGSSGARRLCLAGGVALNCVANGKLLRAGIFDDLFIQRPRRRRGAVGAPCRHHQLLEHPRTNHGTDYDARRLAGTFVQQ